MGARKKPPRSGPPSGPADPFPIVGIGASAGGLQALIEFLGGVPRNSGLALVVVQHLDPGHKGALVELLQRSTELPVAQVIDGVKVEPDHVYVIPPGHDLVLSQGRLRLLPHSAPRGLHLPIDHFLRSLAADRQARAIGVVLSGMGSDGLLGLRAIKEQAGGTFVQDPGSAQFTGMPKASIDAGLADVIAPAGELPARILEYLSHAPQLSTALKPGTATEEALEKVFVLLRAQTGNDFSLYKQSTIFRRIERRISLHQVDLDGYLRLLRENPREIDLLAKELLIGVTSFFRDPLSWEQLKHQVLPALLAKRGSGGHLRAWVAGCSTGEEAYSVAMVVKEAIEALDPPKHLSPQIFATDLDADAIEQARQAVYPDNIVADVSPERLRRFFIKEDGGYRVTKDIREMVVLASQNVIMSPPFTRLDLLCCRNLLIYLSAELQKKLIPLFHYSLTPGGVLFLGSAETVGGHTNLFSPIDAKSRLYRRSDHGAPLLPVELPSGPLSGRALSAGGASPDEPVASKAVPPNLQTLADRVLLQQFAPLGVLCNDRGDVLYISSRSGKFLEPAVGKANLNIFAMAREGLRLHLSSAFGSAVRKNRRVVVPSIKVGSNGKTTYVDLTVQKLAEPKQLDGTVLVVIAEAPEPPAAAKRGKGAKGGRVPPPLRLGELEREIELVRDELQTSREEMQTSQEELKSANEELQSTNEELQSSNEELTTSKEEMQSLNEELQTVNHELEAKVEELSRSNNDMKNLLNSTDIATLFLDSELNVRRFTSPATRIIKLIATDVGRPVTDLVSYLDYSELAADAHEVLRTLVFKERQVSTGDGRWFQMRILPYRTLENLIDGVVITFNDASAQKALETALKEQASQLKQMAESLPSMVWGCRPDGFCDYLSRKWLEYTGLGEAKQLGHGWLEQVHPDDRAATREAWASAVHRGEPFDAELRVRNAQGEWRWFKSRSVAIRNDEGAIIKWWGTHTDVDNLKRSADVSSR